MRCLVHGWGRLAVTVLALVPARAGAGDFPPPVDVSGAVTYSIQETKHGKGDRTLQQAGTVTVNPSTYIYEPWFATTSASINVSKTMNSSADTEGGANILTGTFTLNALPQSAYPLELSYSRFNRDIQLGEDYSELTGQTFRIISRVDLPSDYSLNTRINVDESRDDEGLGEMSNELNFEVDKRFDEDQVRLGLNHRDSTYTGGDEGGDGKATNDGISIRYRSHPFESVTSDSTSTFRVSSYSDDNFSEESRVMQGVTTAVWRPGEIKDLAVHGALRTFRQEATLTRLTPEEEVTVRDSQTAFGTLSSTYIFRPRLVGTAGLNAGYMDTKDTSTRALRTDEGDSNITGISYGGAGGLDYTSESSDVEGFNWSWNTGGSTEAAQNTELGLIHSESWRVGHTANRKLGLWLVDDVNFSATQNSGLGFGSIGGASVPFSHALTLSKNSRDGKMWNFWHLSASDSRQMGGLGATYQLVNLQVTEGYDVDRFASWSASLTFQAARQAVRGVDTGMVDTINGQIVYRERHVLGVENLSFTSDLTLNPPSVIQRRRQQDMYMVEPDVREGNLFGTQRWTNRLDYGIGQLRTSLIGRINNSEEGLSHMALFQISRRF